MLKLSLFLAAIATIASSRADASTQDVNLAWSNFKLDYGKQYRSLYHEVTSMAIFTENYNKIVEHNKLYDEGLVTYSLKVNKFSDLSDEEFKTTFNGYQKSTTSLEDNIETVEFVPDAKMEIPDQFDWRDRGAVTPVKDQGICSACWAFSATGALEGQYFLKTGTPASMSEQNLIDCSKEDGNSGCLGGDMSPAFTYVHNNDGIDSEEGYPFEAFTSDCRYHDSDNVTSAKGYGTIEDGNEDYLKAAIATIGPIAVAIDASQWDFRSYHTGIYYNENCISGEDDPADELDHAVLAVGYGTEDGQDYWLLKNSWGTRWGEEGYIKVARNRNNQCGIASEASFPLNY